MPHMMHASLDVGPAILLTRRVSTTALVVLGQTVPCSCAVVARVAIIVAQGWSGGGEEKAMTVAVDTPLAMKTIERSLLKVWFWK